MLAAAVLLFAFYNYGLYQWLQSRHTFNDVWKAIASDWFLTIAVVDMSLLSTFCLIWLYRDMQRRRWPGAKMAAVLLATLITGVVVLLVYLGFRPKARDEESDR